jgi:hypothetical protein
VRWQHARRRGREHARSVAGDSVFGGQLNPGGAPDWHALDSETFTGPMAKQGFRGWKSQLMAGVRASEALVAVGPKDWRPADLHGVTLADLPGRSVNAQSRVVDLSFQ